MKRTIIFSAIIMCMLIAVAYASTLRYERHQNYIVINFEKPISKGYPAVLDVIWCQDKPNPKEAETVLLEAFKITKQFNVDCDILGTVWYSPTGKDADEEKVTLESGVRSFIIEKGKSKPEPFM